MNFFNLKEMDKEQKQKLLLAVLIGAIGLVFYYTFLIQPQMRRLDGLMPEVREIRRELILMKQDINRVDRLREQLGLLNEQMERYQKSFPLESDLSGLLSYLSAEARKAHVTLLGIEPKAEEEKNSSGIFQEISLTLRAEGGYHELGLFLNRLETGERLMAVDHFALETNPNNPRQHPMRLNLKSYVSKQ